MRCHCSSGPRLMATNLIMRKGHGVYGVTDPFVQEIWLERKSLEGKL